MNSPVLLVVLPLLGAFLLPLLGRASGFAGRAVGPLLLLANLWIGIHAWVHAGTDPQVILLGGFSPLVGIVFYVDRLGLLFALAISLGVLLLWPARDAGPQQLRVSMLTLVLVAATTGLALSGDLFNLYVFYELAAVASYGLAAASGTPQASAATVRFMVISSLGAALMLIGIALVYQSTGTLNLAQLAQLSGELAGPQGLVAFILILLGAGVKAELFPVNGWVPEVYGSASKRVTGILAGIVSKLALLIILRLLVLVFDQPQAAQLLLVLGVLGVISGELAAWRARDLTRMLACSSIGQIGMICIAFSIPGSAGLYAGLALALHHMLVKPALFLLAERWDGAITGLAGAARGSPLAAACFLLLALSLAGIPPLPGFWAKWLLVTAALQQPGSAYVLAMVVVLAAVVVEASYLARVVAQLYQPEPGHRPVPVPEAGTLGVVSLLSVLLLVATVVTGSLGNALQVTAVQAADRGVYTGQVLTTGEAP